MNDEPLDLEGGFGMTNLTFGEQPNFNLSQPDLIKLLGQETASNIQTVGGYESMTQEQLVLMARSGDTNAKDYLLNNYAPSDETISSLDTPIAQSGINSDGSLQAPNDYLKKIKEQEAKIAEQEKTLTEYGQKNPIEYDKIMNLATSAGAGQDLNSTLSELGRYMGMESGTKGKGAGMALSASKALMSGTRSLLGGLGYSKKNNAVRDYYNKQQNEKTYTEEDQTNRVNGLGQAVNEMGGEIQGGMGDINPEQLAQMQAMLSQQGGQPQQAPQQQPQQGEQQQMTEQGQNINYAPGEEIEFEYDGKRHKGIIAKIENGQLFLK